MNREEERQTGLTPYLNYLSVWALSFGCAVGWGAFVMPGTTFLPIAGPWGTSLGILIGAVVMFIIGVNYHYLMKAYPDAGGTMTYTIKAFGYDHGFLSSWFLVLVYIAIVWANATALALIGRNLLGDMFQFGFHYRVLGYDIFFGEMLLSVMAIVVLGLCCVYGKRLSAILQTVMALILFGGILTGFFAVMKITPGAASIFTPPYALEGEPALQIFHIVALAPWAFVGFESVSHSTEEFRFPVKNAFWPMTIALVTGMLAYTFLTIIAASIRPEGYATWVEYIADLSGLEGLAGLPVFYASSVALGQAGVTILCITTLAAIVTGLVGNYIAAGRLLYAMAKERILPPWFGRLNRDGAPGNAFVFLMGVSVLIPFLGRTAIGWVVDVTTIGATIAYGYTSAAAYKTADPKKEQLIRFTGILGLIVSVGFFFYFMAFSAGALSTESYLILATWSILGFFFFRLVFSRDKERRFGKSTVVWIGLLFLIFFTSLMWLRQATDDMTETIVENISRYYEERHPNNDPLVIADTENYLERQIHLANRFQARNSMIQMGLIVVSLSIMFSIYKIMAGREKQMEVEKAKAEESNKAKTVFLSNMSHDIRTPMNAIIGYITLAEREGNDLPQIREYLGKIRTSSHHLLALINDVLEMSRIESGKMNLEPVAVDLKQTLIEVEDMFSTQMREKNIDFTLDTSRVNNSRVLCDKNRLNRVLLNLLSNAYKFTPEGGSVRVVLIQLKEEREGFGSFELRVRDSGIGMSKEFAEKVFEAFEREQNSTVNGIQGTGLGMAITKSLIDLMGGTIEVETSPGNGTEFIIRICLEMQKETEEAETGRGEAKEDSAQALDLSRIRLLLVEDNEINREIATMLLEEYGFMLEEAVNGQEALDRIAAAPPGYFDAVLMDVQMPVMGGYEAARMIRGMENKQRADIPIIAMTANAFSEDVKEALDAGMNAHLAKPIDAEKVVATLRELLS